MARIGELTFSLLCCLNSGLTITSRQRPMFLQFAPQKSSEQEVLEAIALGKLGTGPQNCVTLEVNQDGFCTLQTNCTQNYIDVFNGHPFTYMCLRPGEIPSRHIFPSCTLTSDSNCFKKNETLVTSSKCKACRPASPAEGGSPPNPPKASFYGPGSCVSTFLSPGGTCVIQTKCKNESQSALEAFNYGLTCIEEDGKCVRHLFGTNSFDEDETFDTMIRCKLCLGLDGAVNMSHFVKVKKGEENGAQERIEAETSANYSTVSHDILELRGEVQNLTSKLSSLESRVVSLEGSPSPSTTAVPPSTTTPPSTAPSTAPSATAATLSPSPAPNASGAFYRRGHKQHPLQISRRTIRRTKDGETIETIEYGRRPIMHPHPKPPASPPLANTQTDQEDADDDDSDSDTSSSHPAPARPENYSADYDEAEAQVDGDSEEGDGDDEAGDEKGA